MAIKNAFNLEKQFTFYASYHRQPVNVAIHLLCIWPILSTAILMLQYTPSLMSTPSCFGYAPFGKEAHVNIAFVVAMIYIVCYVVMEPIAGTIGAALVASVYLYSGHLVSSDAHFCGHAVWKVALAVHVVAWILQFIGHGVFEGRAPALLDSLDQALLTAPLFVLLEILFFFGYRKSFHEKIMREVEENIKEFNSKRKSA